MPKIIKTALTAQVTSLLPALFYYPPSPPELAKPTLRPPVAR